MRSARTSGLGPAVLVSMLIAPVASQGEVSRRAAFGASELQPGAPGLAELLQQAAQALKIECVVFDLSIMEPTDLIGMPAKKGGRTVYCPPASLPDGGKGFLVMEELNRAPRYMMAPTLQLLTARRLNDYLLPAGWLPVAAVNPAKQAAPKPGHLLWM